MSFDRHGACLSANKEGSGIIGCSYESIADKRFLDLWPEESRGSVSEAVSTVLSGKQAFFESRAIAEGASRWWAVKLIPVIADENSNPGGFISLSSDITEEKEMAERHDNLQAAEKKYHQYQLIFDSMQDLVHITNKGYEIEFINKACEAAFGPLTSTRCYTYFHGFDEPCRWCRQESVFAGKSFRDELYFERVQAHFDAYNSPMVKPDGSVSKLVILRDISAKKKLEGELLATLEQKNVLVREMHHRVRNNLTMLQSLLGLQERSLSDNSARSSIMDTQSRIMAMSLVHESLYRSADLKNLDAKEYLGTLSGKIFNSCNTRWDDIKLSLDLTDANMDIDTLIPLGLIVSELITNMLKYAFQGDNSGEISVSLNKTGRLFELTARDNGVGLPEGFNIDESASLGMKIIRALVSQIDGTLTISSDKGTAFHLSFQDRMISGK